jgi:ornithine cyclodeaminase
MTNLSMLSAETVERALPDRLLIERLREAFREGVETPLRHHHRLPTSGAGAALLLMPAWRKDREVGVKVVTVFPDNAVRGLPSVFGVYLLLDGRTGAPLALMDGKALTRRRTAAASALAASYLARADSRRLVMAGAGSLAPHLVRAHAAVRPLRTVTLWNRTASRAEACAERLAGDSFDVRVTSDLEAAVGEADVVVCATLSRAPLVRGAWLRPGTHLDLVGGYTPEMREADDEAVRRATVFVDTREGALHEAGDLVQPLRAGVLRETDVAADLFDLCRNLHPGRRDDAEITLFKSVGTALEDLAAARLVYESIG